MKPLAILVQGQTRQHSGRDDYLKELDTETGAVEKALKAANYDVIVCRAPTIQELIDLLHADWNRNRVTLFHFAGHANENYIYFGNEAVEGKKLAGVLCLQVSLRMVFINGCLTREHANHYLELPELQPRATPEKIENVQEKLSVVVTGTKVSDIKACGIARDFYKALAGKQNHRVITAMTEARKLAGLPEIRPEHTEEFDWLLLGDEEFRLVDGVCGMLEFVDDRPPLVPVSRVLMLAGALMLVAGAFAFLSHVAMSSPAFQSSFSYGFSDEFLGKLHSPVPGFVDPSTGLASADPLGRLHGMGPYFGFLVESGRTFFLLLVLVIAAAFMYNYHIPTISPRDRSFLLNRYNLLYVLLAIGVGLGIIGYHTVLAPQRLETASTWSVYKDVLQASENIWRGVGDFWVKEGYKNIKELRANGPDFQVLWRDLYLYPYLWYMPYSLVNFSFIACLLLYTIWAGCLDGQERMDLSLQALNAYVSKGNQWGQATDLASRCYGAINEETRKYMFIMFLIGACFFFECLFGYLTLAPVAFAFLFVAIFMIASVGVCIFVPMVRYASQYGKTKESLKRSMIPDDKTTYFDILSKCDPIQIPFSPINILLVTLNVCVYVAGGCLAAQHLFPQIGNRPV